MCQQVDQGWVFCIAHGGNQEGWCMALAEMIVWSVGGGLKFVEVENGRKVSGASRAQRASYRHFRWFRRIWLVPFACGWWPRWTERWPYVLL